MARPREFDENEVLEKALNAFWARGYDATSIEDLVEATGLGRASLYGAFGDKEQLFHRVVKRYVEQSERELVEATSGLSARHAVEALLQRRLEGYCGRGAMKGCFAQMSAQSGSSAQLIQGAMQVATRQHRAWLLRQLKAAQAEGDVSPDADPGDLADFLSVVVSGLSASVRSGMSPRALKASAEQALDSVFAPARRG